MDEEGQDEMNLEHYLEIGAITVEGVDENLKNLESANFQKMIEKATNLYKNFQVVATTLRGVTSATRNDWGAIAWSRESGFVESIKREDLEIFDRVGGGDSFASGLIYGIMELSNLKEAVEYGAAHGALAMTTPGDTTMATLAEVKKLASGGSARVIR